MNINEEKHSLCALSLDFGITPKELLCLAFWLFDYPDKKVGRMLGNSPRTIETHRSRVMNRFKPLGKDEVKNYLIVNRYSNLLASIIIPHLVN